MKAILILTALLCTSNAFATDLKCHGRAEPTDKEKYNIYAANLNYEVSNNAKDGFTVKDFNDDKSNSSSSNGKAKEWKEGGMKVVGLPGILRVYIHSKYHAVLAEKRGGYDDVPEYTRYVDLTCE